MSIFSYLLKKISRILQGPEASKPFRDVMKPVEDKDDPRITVGRFYVLLPDKLNIILKVLDIADDGDITAKIIISDQAALEVNAIHRFSIKQNGSHYEFKSTILYTMPNP